MPSVITYLYPVAGTTAPTVAQAAQVNSISANVDAVAAGTAVMTHNWGLTTAEQGYGWPIVIQNPTGDNDFPLKVSARDANTVSLRNLESSTSPTVVILLRPHSIIT